MDKLALLFCLSMLFLTDMRLGKCFDEFYDKKEKISDDLYLDNLLKEFKSSLNDADVEDKSKEISKTEEDMKGTVQKSVIKMPGVSPQKHDTYFCVAKKMPEKDTYIVGYEPSAEMHTAHHMLLFGCESPSMKEGTWDCREMHPVCATGMQRILYAWGRNAPPLALPKDVGFKVGGSTGVKYLVLQVHYGDVAKFKGTGLKDYSGVTMSINDKPTKNLAGIFILASGWDKIPPHQKIVNMDVGCMFPLGSPTIVPFAYRTHTHALGVVVSGFRVRNGKWTEIGRGDPQCPQAFYPIKNKRVDIQPGDHVFGRCTFNSMKKDIVTKIGATKADEMCNFYVMFYYDPNCFETAKCTQKPFDGCGYIDQGSQEIMRNFPKYSQEPLKNFCVHENMKKGGKKNKAVKAGQKDYIGYKVVENWPIKGADAGSLPRGFGQVAGVDEDHHEHVVIFHRAYRSWDGSAFTEDNVLNKNYGPIKKDTVVWLKKRTGKITKSWGKGKFYMPHGITIDHEGNLWFTDVGMHQVFKYNLKKDKDKPLLVLGEKLKPGSDDKHFCKPTDVAVDRGGVFYVSDGYCNRRILMFSPKGQLLMKITDKNISPAAGFPSAPYKFNIPHSISLDEENNILFVADRENARVIMFNSLDGKFIREISNVFGDSVYAIAYRDGHLHAVSGSGATEVARGYTYTLVTDKNGRKDPVITWEPPNGFRRPHDIAVSKKSNHIYVAEIGPNKIWKFEKKRLKFHPNESEN